VDIIGIGGLAYDMAINVDQFPCADGKVIATGDLRTPGGFIANSVCAAAALGLNTGFIGWIGEDDGGKLLANDFAQRDVDIDALQTFPNMKTPYTVILVTPNGERSIIVPPNPLYDMPLNDMQLAAVYRAIVVYTYPRD